MYALIFRAISCIKRRVNPIVRLRCLNWHLYLDYGLLRDVVTCDRSLEDAEFQALKVTPARCR